MSYLGEQIPKLGFGLMRLPMIEDAVDIKQMTEMVDLFMSKGFTYFDTAYGYGNGKSEMAAKTTLVDRYPRGSFQLATKLPAWVAANADEAKAMFYTSLERTGAGFFDYYLLHNLGVNRKKSFDEYGIWDFVVKLKEKGLVRHIGFSYHDKADFLDTLLTEHPEMEFVQLQINYADWDSESVQARKNYEVCKKHNKPIIIMEPVKGGVLANPADSVRKILQEANLEASLASWAIRFAASLDNVITVLSGMSNMEQMKDNLSFMAPFVPLSERERAVIDKARYELSLIPSIPCTDCEYCIKGCPQGIKIPDIFDAMNRNMVFDDLDGAKFGYKLTQLFGSKKASECIACGNCEAVCPQQIDIIDTLKAAVALFE